MPAPKGPINTDIPNFGMVSPNRQQIDTSRKEIIIWEEGNPRCLVNLVPDKIREAIKQLPPHFLAMDDHELKLLVDPGPMDEQLRLSFWDEYFIACDNTAPMRGAAIYPRVCSREYFYRFIVSNPQRLAYMIRPPQEYMLKMRSILEMGMRRFEEILKLPVVTKKMTRGGEYVDIVDTGLIEKMIKIVAIADNRVKGAVTQKLVIDQTSKSLNVHMSQDYEPPKSHSEIEKELRDVQNELLSLGTPVSQPLEKIAFEGFNDDREPIEVQASSSKEEGT